MDAEHKPFDELLAYRRICGTFRSRFRAKLDLVLGSPSVLNLPLMIDPGDRRISSSDDTNSVDIDVIENAS